MAPGYRPRHPAGEHTRHRKGKACPRCIWEREVELGYRQWPPPPPPGRGAGSPPRPRLPDPGRGIER